MGSGGSQTLWSPSNEAGAYIGFLIDAVHKSVCLPNTATAAFGMCNLYIWAGLTTAIVTIVTVASADVDGGTLKRDKSN